MKTWLFSISCFVVVTLNAQSFILDQFVFGGDWSDEPIKSISANESLYVIFKLGSPTGTGNWNFDNLDCGGFRTLLVKLDETGQSLWQKMFCGNASDTPTDMIDVGDGVLISMASTSSSGTGNKTSELFTNQQFPFPDYWLVKLDYDGNIVWQKTYGSYESDRPLSLSLANNGNILVTGYSAFLSGGFNENVTGNKTAVSKGGSDTWVLLLDENGDEIWQRTIGVATGNQSYISARNGLVLPNGNFLICSGASYQGASGDKTAINFGPANAWLVCLDQNGNQLWDKVYGGDGGEYYGHIIASDNHVYCIVQSSSGISGNRTSTTKGLTDILVYKLDFDGNIISQNNFGDAGMTDIYSSYLHENRIILCLIPDSEVPSLDKSEPSRGEMDLWILSFDTETLELVNEKTYGGAESDLARSVVFFDDHLYITGWSASGVSGDKTVPNFGLGNAWVLKVNPTHLLTTNEHVLINSTIFPNPTTNQINISFSEPTKLKKAILYDMSGKAVLEQDLSSSFEAVYVVNTKGLAGGVYSLSLVGEGFVKTQQVVVE